MSDRELVTIDRQQFDALLQGGDAIKNTLAHIERTLFNGLDVIAQGGGDNSQVLTAINNLDRKVDEFMATQEERLRGVKTKLDAIQTGVDKIQQQLADLKANNPELDDEISAIEATANAIDTDVNPVVEPPAEGGDTGTTEPTP